MASGIARASGTHPPVSAELVSAPPALVAGEISVTDVRKSFEVTRALDGCTFTASAGRDPRDLRRQRLRQEHAGQGDVRRAAGRRRVRFPFWAHAHQSPHDARAIGIATVFQEVLVADESSIVDNLYLGADHLWSRVLPAKAKISAARALMAELTGADIDVEMLVGTLPLSVKQWITIGRALLSKPKVLILDESSAALDLDSTERLFDKDARVARSRVGRAHRHPSHRRADPHQ